MKRRFLLKKKVEKTKFKFKPTERFLKPDPRHQNLVIAKLINQIMWQGKKNIAQNIVYRAMDIIKEKVKDKEPLDVVTTAINNVKPQVEVRSKRVGGATYQVPVEVRSERQTALGIRWIIQQARSRGEKSMRDRLAAELLDAANNRGAAVKKREDTHRMAEANKAFAHYRW